MNVDIQKIGHDDIDDIHDIETACFSVPWSKESLSDAVNSTLWFIYGAFTDSGELAGYINTTFLQGELTVNNIAVKTEFRRHGIAENLLNYAIKKLDPDVCFLEVRESNSAAINLYRKLGFEQIAVRKGYYSLPKEDALIMRLILRD